MKVLSFSILCVSIFAFAACVQQTANANLKHEITMPEATLKLLKGIEINKLVLSDYEAERFWGFVDKNGPVVNPELGKCWIWNGPKSPLGYALFLITEKGCRKSLRYIGSRVSLIISGVRFTPERPHALHSCHNPPCVNPSHLHIGNARENTREMMEAGRFDLNGRRKFHNGERNSQAKTTDEAVGRMKQDFRDGMTIAQLSRKYHLSNAGVSCIVKGITWRHIA